MNLSLLTKTSKIFKENGKVWWEATIYLKIQPIIQVFHHMSNNSTSFKETLEDMKKHRELAVENAKN